MEYLPWRVMHQVRRWPPMMHKTIRAQTQVMRHVGKIMRRPLQTDRMATSTGGAMAADPRTSHPLRWLEGRIEELIRPVLDHFKSPPRAGGGQGVGETVISVYLIDPCGQGEHPLHGGTDGRPGIYLSNVAQVSSNGATKPIRSAVSLKTQDCLDPGGASITVCTVLTQKSMYVDQIDAPGTTSFGFSLDMGPGVRRERHAALVNFAAVVNTAFPSTPSNGPTSPPSFRVDIIGDPEELDKPLMASIVATYDGSMSDRSTPILNAALNHLENISKKFDAVWVAAKLRKTVRCDFSQIYQPIQEGQRATAELCVPILVEGSAIGCVNLEGFDAELPRFTATNMLFNLATLIGSVVVASQSRKMRASIEHAVTRIMTDRVLDRKDFGIEPVTRAIQRSLWAQSVVVYVRDPYTYDDRFVEFVGLHEEGKRNSEPLRTDGWTSYIASHANPEIRGVVLYVTPTVDGKGEPRVERAYHIGMKRLGPTASTSTDGGLGESVPWIEPIDIEEVAKRFASIKTVCPPETWIKRCQFFVGLSLRTPESGRAGEGAGLGGGGLGGVVGGRNTIQGVMWCANSLPIVDLPSDRASQRQASFGKAQIRYMAHAMDAAERCALLPTIYRSHLFSPGRFFKYAGHGQVATLLSHVISELDGHPDVSLASDGRETLEKIRLFVDYVRTNLQHMGRLSSPNYKDEFLGYFSRRSNIQHTSLQLIVQEAWMIAEKASSSRRTESPRIEIDAEIDTCPSMLREILVQVFANSLKHATLASGQRLRVVGEVRHLNGYVELVVYDNGSTGFPPWALGALRVATPDAPQENGLGIIESLASLLGTPQNPFSRRNRPEGGAEWTFRLPLKLATGRSRR